MIHYVLNRSQRKTVAIYILKGGVEVRAPLRMPKRDIDRFVASKEKWIVDKLANVNKQAARREAFCLDYGSSFTYRGKQYLIEAREGNRIELEDALFYMPPGMEPGQIKAACVQMYRMLAKHDLNEKTLIFSKQMGVSPNAVKINSAKTRWGSCSSRKSINFSWRLIMADDEVIDYVVVHELAHLIEMNHSTRFWAIVKNILPDYRERKARLLALQKRLANEEWE